ncbi:hypothetical protein BLA29_004861, partial [Euroglyphus maynei]
MILNQKSIIWSSYYEYIYLRQPKQNLIPLVLEITRKNYKENLNKHHMLNIMLLSLLNCICDHQTGKQTVIEHFLSPKNCPIFIENLFDYDSQTRFVQKEIHLLMVKIIGFSFDIDQAELQKIFITKFTDIKSNLPEFFYNIIDLFPQRNEFCRLYDVFSLLENFLSKLARLDNDSLKQLIKLIELILPLNIDENKMENLINLIGEKLLKQQDCFSYSTFLISLSNFQSKFIKNNKMYRAKSFKFLHHYLTHLQLNPGQLINGLSGDLILSHEERIMLENTIQTRSLTQFQTQCFQQLIKLQPTIDEYNELVPLLEDVIIKNSIPNNKKHLNMVLTFFEKLILQNLVTDYNSMQHIYYEIYSNYPVAQKSILQSIFDIYRKRKIFDFPKFFPILLKNHLINSNNETDDDGGEIIEIIIELIFTIILNDEQNSLFAKELNEFLSAEYSYMLKTIDLGANCRANILSTLFMAHH